MTRTDDQKREEVAAITAALSANASQRDAFIALGHTVLFTASIAFMGDVRPADEIEFVWVLLVGWTLNAIGLVALTWSFQAAHEDGVRRIAQIHDDAADVGSTSLHVANCIALWTFPTAMIAIAIFASLNLWSVM